MPVAKAVIVFRSAWTWCREKGLRSLCARLVQKLWPRLAARWLITHITSLSPDVTLCEVVNFVWSDQSRLIRPVQVKSEFSALLGDVFDGPRPRCVMEIGTLNGGTLFTFCRSAAENACVISLDLPGGAFGGGYPAWKNTLYQAFALPGQQLHLVRQDSHDPATLVKIRQILGDRQIDFLFIDGDHTYEGVRQDFEMYAPLVRDGGVVGFHDIVTHPKATQSQVDLFWEQIKREYDHWEFVKNPAQRWGGIGVVKVRQGQKIKLSQ